MQPEPEVHVVDDDDAVLRSASFLLTAHQIRVKTHTSAASFLESYTAGVAGCVLSDVRMPEMDGIELLRKLRGDGSSLPFIVMTGHADVPLAVEAMKEGATDVVEKPYAGETLLGMVRGALSRWQTLSAEEARGAEARRQLAVLSPRERGVLAAVAEGKASKAIAFDLGLSVRTIEVHRANILAKLKVDNAALAVAKLIAARD